MSRSIGGHVPFEVRCRLRTPVCLNHPWVNFDGVLGYLVHRRVLGRGYYDLPGKQRRFKQVNMRDPKSHLGLWLGQEFVVIK